MYVVTKVFDDNSASIIDIGTYKEVTLTESEIKNFCKNHAVLGVDICKNKIYNLMAYSTMQFASDTDAYEYAGSDKNVMYIQGMYWVFTPDRMVHHVAYYVTHYTEVECTFIAEKGYCGYMEYAKQFTKDEAYKKCASLNKAHAKKYNVPKSNYWQVCKEVIY